MDEDEFDLYDMDAGGPAAFLGAGGTRGLLRWTRSGWTYFKPGSLEWDSAHQAVYRNHRAMRMSLEQLSGQNIPPPPVELHRGPVERVAWSDNFRSSLPVAGVPNSVLARIPGLVVGRPAPVYLVLVEDQYETSFGDGRFLYPQAAFWDAVEATTCLGRLIREDAERRTGTSLGSSYTLKAVELARDDEQGRIVADLKLALDEHYSIDDVVRLLSAAR